MLDWTGIHDFLAVAEQGSFSAAARKLKLSQPTLGRRIAALEAHMGADLFVRTARGLHLTAMGESILDAAKAMREEALTVERIATGSDQNLSGEVRLSVTDSIGAEWLVAHLAVFHRQYPRIGLELILNNTVMDISKREADIAIRFKEPAQPDLIARDLGVMRYGFFASKNYAAAHDMPKTLADLRRHHMVMPDERLFDIVRQTWPDIDQYIVNPVFKSNSSLSMATATMHGIGIGIHSALMAWRAGNLVRVLPDIEYPPVRMWLVTHAELRRSARIRAVFSFLRDLILENHHLFDSFPTDAQAMDEAGGMAARRFMPAPSDGRSA